MAPCNKCSKLRSEVRATPTVETSGSYPTILELAYMVNLEYYVKIGSTGCIHEIPEVKNVRIPVSEMVDFLDVNKWKIQAKTSYGGFSCACFVNTPKKQVVIVHRGTELTNWQQLKTDVQMAFKVFTQEVFYNADWHTYQSLMNYALVEKDDKFVRNDYTVTITGHSLGGWLAQICTLICKNPKFHPIGPRNTICFGNGKSIDLNQPFDLHCVAFDSPGAGSVLKRLEDQSKSLAGQRDEMIEAIQNLDITIFLSNSNLVNRCDYHVGSQYRIDVMADASFLQNLNPIASHSMERIVEYFKKEGSASATSATSN